MVRHHTNHSSIGRWDQGRACVAYRSTPSACSHVHPKSCYILKDGQYAASFRFRSRSTIPIHSHALVCFFPTTSIWSHLSSLEITVAWRALMVLAHRTLSHILSKSHTYWRKREEGSYCGHYTTNHALIVAVSSQVPTISSSLPSPSVNRRVTYRQ